MGIDRLSLGTAQLGMPYGVANEALVSAQDADEVLSRAFDLGIRALDTAPVYGLAESRIGDFLGRQAVAGQIRITTKLPGLGDIAGSEVGSRVETELRESLSRLRSDSVHVYLVHDQEDLRRHGRALVDALLRQVEAGRIGSAGVSVYGPEDVELTRQYAELEVIQHPYNVFDTRLTSTGTLAELLSSGRRVQLRSVFLQGLLAMDTAGLPAGMSAARSAVLALRDDLDRLQLSPVDVALPFAMAVQVETVVVGADNVTQLEEIVRAAERRLSDSVLEVLARHACPDQRGIIDPREW